MCTVFIYEIHFSVDIVSTIGKFDTMILISFQLFTANWTNRASPHCHEMRVECTLLCCWLGDKSIRLHVTATSLANTSTYTASEREKDKDIEPCTHICVFNSKAWNSCIFSNMLCTLLYSEKAWDAVKESDKNSFDFLKYVVRFTS